MSAAPEWPLGLAWMAHELARDLQRAARQAGGPARLWRAGPERLGQCLAAEPAVLSRALAARTAFSAGRAREQLARDGVVHLPLGGLGYPARLGRIYDPPFGLFGRGTVVPALARADAGPSVAIVGSRHPSGAGRRLARELGAELARRGAVVVSGLARGIDGAAHEGALDAGGCTIAVLGSAVDRVHPRRHLALAERIEASGAVLSEYWPGTEPAPWRFPARNRIVAGLADAVVVVEAASRSGALITADFAIEHGTPVLAVPGWPGAEMSAGCNALIRAGAALCETVADVIDEVPHAGWNDATMAPARDPATQAVLRAVAHDPADADRLAAATGLAAAEVARALVALEIEGVVAREPGGIFRAIGRPGGR